MIDNELAEYKRRKRLINQFIRRLIFGLITVAVILLISFVITETPILTNQVALGQMENSNDWFVVMAMYQKFVPVVKSIRNILVSVIVVMIALSGYDLAKSLNT